MDKFQNSADRSKIYNNFYFSITKAHGLVGSTIGSVQGTFANVKDEEKALQIFLDVLGLGYGLFAAATWAPRKNSPMMYHRDTKAQNANSFLSSQAISIFQSSSRPIRRF